jgi:hypothetical protein
MSQKEYFTSFPKNVGPRAINKYIYIVFRTKIRSCEEGKILKKEFN